MSCPYKNIFGKPKTGFHSTRVFGLAAGDTIGTIVIAGLIAYVWKLCFWRTLLILFIIGEVLHYVFGTQTQFLTWLGIKAC